MIEILPPELLANILSYLDLCAILRCKQVNRLFHDIIGSASIQYKITLAVEGQEDLGTSDLSIPDKHSALKQYAASWENLDFPHREVIRMSRGGLWELYGNVLAQNFETRPRIDFHQLKSGVRGIDSDHWCLESPNFAVRDFGLDSAQDLLVLVENPRWKRPPSADANYYRFHIRHLRTGENHPKSALNPCYVSVPQEKPDPEASYAVQTSGDHFGVHIAHRLQTLPDELLIWNWKTGALHLHLIGDEIHSYAFLSESHVIVGVVPNFDPPHLKVFAFNDSDVEPTSIEDSPYVISFELPPLDDDAHMAELHLRCDPSPVWRPSHPAPFSTCPENRVYIATFWVHTDINMHCCSLAIPRATILSYMEEIPSKRLTWHIWGPSGSRLFYLPWGHSTVWVCYVYGSRFFMPQVRNGQIEIAVLDFNQVAARKAITDSNLKKDTGTMESFTEPSLVGTEHSLFTQSIETRLPYRRAMMPVDDRGPSAVLISEDGLVLVHDRESQYHVLSM